MNIFFLSPDQYDAAAFLCDKHVPKMVLETAQLLSTAHHIHNSPFAEKVYKKAYLNHPITQWVASSRYTYGWTYNYLDVLCSEYTYRYGKNHASKALLDYLANNPITSLADWTDPPQCMPDKYKQADTVEAYRDYYAGEKHHFAKWERGRNMPTWYIDRRAYLDKEPEDLFDLEVEEDTDLMKSIADAAYSQLNNNSLDEYLLVSNVVDAVREIINERK